MRMLQVAALIGVLALMALVVGVAPALADEEVVLCKLSVSLCPEEEIYLAHQLFKGEATSSIFSNPNVVKCKASNIEGETLASMGNPLPVEIKEMSFSFCSPCNSVLTLKRPYQGGIVMDAGGQYLLSVSPIAEIVCPEFKCIFKGEGVVLEVLNNAGKLEVVAKEEELTLSEGSPLLCSSTTHWSTVYNLSEPSPVYLSLFEL